jgi:hypothetical protein
MFRVLQGQAVLQEQSPHQKAVAGYLGELPTAGRAQEVRNRQEWGRRHMEGGKEGGKAYKQAQVSTGKT